MTDGPALPTPLDEERPTRERIVDVAMHRFWADGYRATPLSRILEEAGVNPGSLYHYFPSKQDLLIAVLDRYLEGIRPMLLDPVWDAHDDPVERVFGLLDAYRDNVVATDCTYGCPIGNLALELADPDPPVRERIARNLERWVAAVEACLADARERFPAGTDLHALAVHVLTTMEGAVMQARAFRSVEPFDESVARLRDYFDRLHEAALADPPSIEETVP